MRIGLFTDSYKPYISGVTTSLFLLLEGLKAEGHEVFIITTTDKGYKQADRGHPYIIRIKGIPLFQKGLRFLRYVPLVGRHMRKIEKLDLDLIHIHTEFSIGTLALKMKKKHNLPLVYTIHTMYEEYLHFLSQKVARKFRRPLVGGVKKMYNRFVSKAEAIIVPSKKMEKLMETYGIEGNFKVVPTGIDLKKFQQQYFNKEDVVNFKKSYGLKEDDFVCLYVGRISLEKDIDMLIDGFKNIKKDNIKFLIVGDGPHLKPLKEKVEKLNLFEQIIFTGFISWQEIGLVYQIGDVFINASKSETQGLTYIEAMASGLPLIVRYDKVLEDVVVEGYNGFFFAEKEQMQGLIEKLYNDKNLRTLLSENAVKSIGKYDKKLFTKNALKVYDEAIEIVGLKKINNKKQ